jgi:hypothetical protein
MKKIIFLLVIIASYYGCKKDSILNYSSSLIGEWFWLKSCGGFAGGCDTPQSTNETMNLSFTIDSVYNYYLNDTLRGSGRFHVYKNVISYENSISRTFLISHDTLYLNDYCCDGFNSNYKRIK